MRIIMVATTSTRTEITKYDMANKVKGERFAAAYETRNVTYEYEESDHTVIRIVRTKWSLCEKCD